MEARHACRAWCSAGVNTHEEEVNKSTSPEEMKAVVEALRAAIRAASNGQDAAKAADADKKQKEGKNT